MAPISQITDQFLENSPPASGHHGTVGLVVRKDTATSLATLDGNYTALEVDSTGKLWVNLDGVATETTLLRRYGSGIRTNTALEISSLGDNIIITPSLGQRLRIFWVGFSTSENNTAEVLAIVKFGVGGSAQYRWTLGTPGLFSHWETLEGAINESLIVNLSGAQPVQVNITHEEF